MVSQATPFTEGGEIHSDYNGFGRDSMSHGDMRRDEVRAFPSSSPGNSGGFQPRSMEDEDDIISACCASTDSDTSFDLPAEFQNMADDELGQALFFQHATARRQWRTFTGKPTRKVRGYTRGLKQRKFVQKTSYTRSSGSRPSAGRGSSGSRDGSGRFKPTYR